MSIQREQTGDILKGLGIIAVVIGHSGSPLGPFVYMYHLSLFFFVSGYYYNDLYSSDPSILIAKRVKSLYWPWVKYGLLMLVLHNVFYYLSLYSDDSVMGSLAVRKYSSLDFLRMGDQILLFTHAEQLAGAMWFVPVLFLLNVIFCLVRYTSNRLSMKHSLTFTACLSIALFVIGLILADKHIQLSLNADISLIAMPIFFFGFILKKSKARLYLHWGGALFCLIVLVAASNKYGLLNISARKLINPFLYIGASLAGIYMNIYFANSIQKNKTIANAIAIIGERSLMILALHFLSFKLVSLMYILAKQAPTNLLARFPVISGENGWWCAYALAGVGVPVLLSWMWSITRKLFPDTDSP